MPAKQSDRMRREMSVTNLGTMIDFYDADMRLKNRTTDSINGNLGNLKHFAAYAGGLDVKLNSITLDTARDNVAWLQSRQTRYEDHPRRPPEEHTLSPFTIRKAVKVLRGFGTWMAGDELPNPFVDLDIPSVHKTIVETLRPEEVQKILAGIDPNTPNGARNRPVISPSPERKLSCHTSPSSVGHLTVTISRRMTSSIRSRRTSIGKNSSMCLTILDRLSLRQTAITMSVY
jgi:hypothetical protein